MRNGIDPCCVRGHSELLVRKSGILDIIEAFRSAGDPSGMTAAILDASLTRRTYDHRLREHVVRCDTMAIAKHVQIPLLSEN